VLVVPNPPVVGCPKIDLFVSKKTIVRLRRRCCVFELTGTKSPGTKRASLGLLRCSTKGGGGLGLRLSKGSGAGAGTSAESTSACGCSAFGVSVVRTRSKRNYRTESTSGGLLTEGSVTKETAGLLLRLRGTKTTSGEAG
jgi:hypothetical protein